MTAVVLHLKTSASGDLGIAHDVAPAAARR